MNFADTILRVDALSPKDHGDLQFSLKLGVDWVALSFVRTAGDVQALRTLVKDAAKIVVKIEKPRAVVNIESILEATGAIMALAPCQRADSILRGRMSASSSEP